MSDPKPKPRIILRGGRWWAGVDLRENGSLLIVPMWRLGVGATPHEAYQDWSTRQSRASVRGDFGNWKDWFSGSAAA